VMAPGLELTISLADKVYFSFGNYTHPRNDANSENAAEDSRRQQGGPPSYPSGIPPSQTSRGQAGGQSLFPPGMVSSSVQPPLLGWSPASYAAYQPSAPTASVPYGGPYGVLPASSGGENAGIAASGQVFPQPGVFQYYGNVGGPAPGSTSPLSSGGGSPSPPRTSVSSGSVHPSAFPQVVAETA
jgi:hypothetical protein